MSYWSWISSNFVINIQKSFVFVLADCLIFLQFLLDTFQSIFYIAFIYFFIHVSSIRIVFPYLCCAFNEANLLDKVVYFCEIAFHYQNSSTPPPRPIFSYNMIFFPYPKLFNATDLNKKKLYDKFICWLMLSHAPSLSIFILIFWFLLNLKRPKNLLHSLLGQMVFVVQKLTLLLSKRYRNYNVISRLILK